MVDPPKYPGTHVFINLLGLQTEKDLKAKEAPITQLRTGELHKYPDLVLRTFDLPHLKAIHKHLFQDIYDWAGETRSYSMRLGGNVFTPHDEIVKYAGVIAQLIAGDDFLRGCSVDDACQKLAKYLGLINKLHPFPDGNGRTQRIFLSQLAYGVGLGLDWEKAPQWLIIESAIRAHEDNNYAGLEMLIEKILISSKDR